jgi:hypothetical protein
MPTRSSPVTFTPPRTRRRHPRLRRRRPRDAWYDTAGALEDAWEIEAAISSLYSLIGIRGHRLLRADLDDDDLDDQEAAARMDRRLLQQIQRGITRLLNSQHPRPELPDFVLARADELGVKLLEGN